LTEPAAQVDDGKIELVPLTLEAARAFPAVLFAPGR
jgi:hypothetical protein